LGDSKRRHDGQQHNNRQPLAHMLQQEVHGVLKHQVLEASKVD
jgi:hypothetical protein